MNAWYGRHEKWPRRILFVFFAAGVCLTLAACSPVSAAGPSATAQSPKATGEPTAIGTAGSATADLTTPEPAAATPAAANATTTGPEGATATPDRLPPVVTVMSPASGAVLPAEGVVGVTVSASDDNYF